MMTLSKTPMFRPFANVGMQMSICNSPSITPWINTRILDLRQLWQQTTCQTSPWKSLVSFPKRLFSAVPMTDRSASLNALIEEKFPEHPFCTFLTKDNALNVMKRYFAMSEAFPYIQAGAYHNLIETAIKENRPITTDVEKTFVVGSFLSWDETGGNYLLRKEGMKGLPQILNTRQQFHSNLLRTDLIKIFGNPLEPDYCSVTRPYLLELMKRLGSENPIERCAMMVAFEMHAGRMIEGLWNSLVNIFNVKKEELTYFEIHVGGDDPAEEYHIKMTKKMIQNLITENHWEDFIKAFIDSYRLNYEWCRNICKTLESNHSSFTRSSKEIEEMRNVGHWPIT